MFVCLLTGAWDVADILLKSNAQVNMPGRNAIKPIHLAAENGIALIKFHIFFKFYSNF